MAVSVNDDFARFGSKSYAINKINSVDVRERQPHGITGAVICGILAAVSLLAALGSIGSPEGGSLGTFIVALVFVGLAYWQWQRSKKREYLLFLMTSSSETQAFVTGDQNEVLDLRARIEAAMLQHSRRGGA